ncbi:EFR1 family ferrodoxin [Halanaerobiaceae bacterium Z-7014]|uniref:EFR1 family ferrodoxin n=1 Tax=Halonatronomonas betaini TaxID=2778430 RepID=A0A931AQ32_9FIRM|nr:EFR1 family ferrodoxin [Halonatronomonas betaini]MBF8436893.1 EFR1 family ferrodoxin [Halonatronomonas betaini]
MNLKLLYFSATDNTEAICKEIAAGIKKDYQIYDLTSKQARGKAYSFAGNDLLIVGVPVYSGRVPEFLVKVLQEIKGSSTPAVFVVTYGNRDYDDALLELKDIFEANGFKGIAGAAFIGEHSYGKEIAGERPDSDDLRLAREFGIRILKKLIGIKDLSDWPDLEVKGSYPLKERSKRFKDIRPETTEACTECGICAENCPMEIISFENFRDIEPGKCIRCCGCIQKCPEDAKYFADPGFNRIKSYLIKNFSDIRKDPDLFI